MDKNKLFGEKNFFGVLGVCAPWKKIGQKMKFFEIFFDIIDNHACVHMHIKKIFKIFNFLAKFFPWSAHAQPHKKNFFAKKFIFVHIFILDVHIYCQNVLLAFRNAVKKWHLQCISESRMHILTIKMDI